MTDVNILICGGIFICGYFKDIWQITEYTASACYGQALLPVKILLNMLDFTHLSAELV